MRTDKVDVPRGQQTAASSQPLDYWMAENGRLHDESLPASTVVGCRQSRWLVLEADWRLERLEDLESSYPAHTVRLAKWTDTAVGRKKLAWIK